jgi:hypothetical protein
MKYQPKDADWLAAQRNDVWKCEEGTGLASSAEEEEEEEYCHNLGVWI